MVELFCGGVVTLGRSEFAVRLGVSAGLGLESLCITLLRDSSLPVIPSNFGYLARILSSFSLSRLAGFVRLGQKRI